MRALRESYGMTVLLFFLPAILAWLAALAGFSIPLGVGNNLLIFTAFWIFLELSACLYYISGIKNRKGMGVAILTSALLTFVGTWVVFTGATFSSHGFALSDDTSNDDAEMMYFAGVTLMSALMPFVPFVLAWLFVTLISTLSAFGIR
jgi:hypothetical protein